MKITIEIEGPIAVGKTRLAQFLESRLREEYSVEFIDLEQKNMPRREIYRYDIALL